MTYLSRLTITFLSCFSHFLREHFGLTLGSDLGLGIGLSLRYRVRFEVRVRSILFICTTVIEKVSASSRSVISH